jgi:hypothetical protein
MEECMDRLIVAVLAGACAMATASTLGGQTTHFANETEWQRQVELQLGEDNAEARELGLMRTHRPFYGQLRDGHYMTVDVDLQANTHYYFFGVCDADCSDLDLRLFDDHDLEVDHDTDPDDTPMVEVTPRYTARFHLRIIMSSCADDPCWVGVGVYGR